MNDQKCSKRSKLLRFVFLNCPFLCQHIFSCLKLKCVKRSKLAECHHTLVESVFIVSVWTVSATHFTESGQLLKEFEIFVDIVT